MTNAEAAINAKANASEVSDLQDDVDGLSAKVTTLEASSGSYYTAITDLQNRMSSAETGLQAKASASDVTTL